MWHDIAILSTGALISIGFAIGLRQLGYTALIRVVKRNMRAGARIQELEVQLSLAREELDSYHAEHQIRDLRYMSPERICEVLQLRVRREKGPFAR